MNITYFVSDSDEGGRYLIWKRVCSGSDCAEGWWFRSVRTCNSIIFGTYFVLNCVKGREDSRGGDISGSNYGKRVAVSFFQ